MTSFYTNVSRLGNNILFRGYENGRRFSRKVEYEPFLFVDSQEQNTEYRSFIGHKPVQKKRFESINDAKNFAEKYKDVSGLNIYGTTDFVTQFIQEQYPNEIKFDFSKLHIFGFDIEVDISEKYPDMETADNQINSISVKSSRDDKYHLLGLKDYDKNKTESGIDPDKIQFMKFDDEKSLLLHFIQIWKNDFPDMITGWNVEYFDIAYVITRIVRLFGEAKAKELSPWGKIRRVTKKIFNREEYTYDIMGITAVDFMDAFKKFGYKYGKQPTYKLDHIASVVLDTKKLDYSEYGSLTELYEKNPQKYLDYNLVDTHLIELMEEETGLLSLVATVAYTGGVNYKDTFGTVGIWESTIYRKLMSKNLVPDLKRGPQETSFDLVGGYVKDPKVGMSRWVVSFDLNSLYPHLMLQYNMSPETYVPEYVDDVTPEKVLRGEYQNTNSKYSICANGVAFSNEKLGVIPEIIDQYYGGRKKVKVEMLEVEQQIENTDDPKEKKKLKKTAVQLHNFQMMVKIMMNSLYGATANKYFLYYINAMAEAITTSGQLSIQYAQKFVNEYLNKVLKTENVDYVVYCDTDSIYVDFSKLIERTFGTVDIERHVGEDFLDKVCKAKIEGVLEKGYEELSQKMGAYRNAMTMKREKITDKTIFVAKKKYMMNVLNSEGVHYETPKISVTGLESVRSSTPNVCRKKLASAFDIILNQDESSVQKFILDFKEEFRTLPPEEIAKNSGTDDIEKFKTSNGGYSKGCPIHVRGAILFNQYIERKGYRHMPIKSGDKVKFLYLKMPNPLRENVISFVDVLPKELGLHDYIDIDLQFEKVFVKPLTLVLNSVGWNHEKIDTLADFFS